jgi:hypothetical protein
MVNALKPAFLTVLASALAAGCATEVPGYANNRAGRDSANEMCGSVRGFLRAPLDDEGLRRAWFLPFGSYDDGSFDFYAPMASDPNDAASSDFYRKRVGQLTHYVDAPDFVEALVTCLSRPKGFERTQWQRTDETARAVLKDQTTSRIVVIYASNSTTSILVAADTWKGDLETSMLWPRPSDPEMPPNSSLERARNK